jgi:8-oxo-dGTP pyrophosphatase MutT (NUDIX family)
MEPNRAKNANIKPVPAATVILVRDGDAGPEVLLLRREARAVFGAGAHVFPGGRVDTADHDTVRAGLGGALTDPRGSGELNLPGGGLAYWVAALRECYEEAGLLLASGERASGVAADTALRQALRAGETSLANICRDYDLRLATGRMRYFSHWITPRGQPRRFDTRFFLAPAPAGQTASACGQETFDPCWLRPALALERVRQGCMVVMRPTRVTLESLAGYASAAALLQTHGSIG